MVDRALIQLGLGGEERVVVRRMLVEVGRARRVGQAAVDLELVGGPAVPRSRNDSEVRAGGPDL